MLARQAQCPALVRLTGVPDFPVDPEVIARRLVERYGFGRVTDASTWYANARLDRLAEEDTVAAHVVRLARRRIEEAVDDEKAVVERALRIALRALEVS